MLPLDGFIVVDLSVGIAGAYCTKLLADGGADSDQSRTTQGDPLRRWSASGAEVKAGEDGALFSFLAGAKHSVVVDPGTPTTRMRARAAGDRRCGGVVARIRGRRASRVRARRRSPTRTRI